MKSVLSLIALAALFGTCCCFQSECNATLPWNVSKEDHPAIPPERLEELLRCPEELHGCSALRVNCTEDLFAVTCSCAENCERYGDCCWDAGASLSSQTASKCISRNVEKFSRREFYVVSGCDLNWPDDEVRSSCENATELKDPFYLIPVTTEQLTYFNAFCALCNYDLDSRSMFWNASGSAGRDLQVAPPQYALENSDLFFWPCDGGLVEVKTCPEGTDSEIKRKCLTYFAPVRSETNETEVVYKNVYCGLCNGAELSSMKCLPKQVVREIWGRVQLRTRFRPNLLSLIRPVVSQDSCFSWHEGKCYIKAPQYHYANTSMPTAENETIGNNTTNVTSPEHEPYNVQNYLTVICISLSLVCLFLKGVVYMLNRSSRTFSSRCTLCLSATLFCSHLLFLLGNSFDVSKPVCVVFAAVLHYGFLSTFFWTSVLSFDIWKNVAAVRLSSSRHGGFLLYALVAWGGPVVVVAVCLVLDWTAPHFVLSPQYGRFACWIGSLWSQLAFFLVPMVILLILDIGLYIHIVVKIRDTAKRAAAFDFKGGGNKSHMALFVKLAFIMGTTWLLGFVGAFVNALALDIIVIVLIGLQGVYLFFGFKDYEHLLPKRFRRKRRAVATGVSTTHTELSSSGKDFSSREDISRSPAVRSFEKQN